jgi:hypothetical protein
MEVIARVDFSKCCVKWIGRFVNTTRSCGDVMARAENIDDELMNRKQATKLKENLQREPDHIKSITYMH